MQDSTLIKFHALKFYPQLKCWGEIRKNILGQNVIKAEV